MSKSVRFKTFRNKSIPGFISEYSNGKFKNIPKGEKIKLCSSDEYKTAAENFFQEEKNTKNPVMIGNVGGFYVAASLAGMMAAKSNSSKPYLLLFDKKNGNMQNAIFNSYLVQISATKEEYLKNLFGFNDLDIIKALAPKEFDELLEEYYVNGDYSGLTKTERKKYIKDTYLKNQDKVDKELLEHYISPELMTKIYKEYYDVSKLAKYASKKEYNSEEHYNNLIELASQKLNKEDLELFLMVAKNITDYLATDKNYHDLVKYLSADIKLNKEKHLLGSDSIYNGYKSLFYKKGSGFVKFLPGIDVSNKKGVEALKNVLKKEGFIESPLIDDDYPIDIAFIPHMSSFKELYSLIRENVQNYMMLYKESKKDYFVLNSTATLNIRTLDNIGASSIEQERKNRIKIKNIERTKEEKGFPLLAFMAGVNFGNIYSSEPDIENMIDIAIANKVDTVYIQGLIYSTYYHNQTSRRLLTDPTYETLESRLQAAKKLVKRFNDAGIKVVYQMSDEESHLYEDLFDVYVKEQGVRGNNFLKREDLKSQFDWVRPIIKQELIPYMLRSGEDIVNFYTDDEKKTAVSDVCHAIKRYKDGLPLGDLSQHIDPKYLHDTDMFKIVFSSLDRYDKKDSSLSINLIANPNSSRNSEPSNPQKRIKEAVKTVNGKVAQLNVDAREGFQGVSFEDDRVCLNVPQMVDDYMYDKPELLSGIKEDVAQDRTRKRNLQTAPKNRPGGYIITGDSREIMTIVPYFPKVRENMEKVQKTGKGYDREVEIDLNDIHTGSLAEKLDLVIKFIDYAIYEEHATRIVLNGDGLQGWNFKSYPIENRVLGGVSMSNQVDVLCKMLEPYIRCNMGTVDFEFKDKKNKTISDNITMKIFDHLVKKGLITLDKGSRKGEGFQYRIVRGINYKTVDLDLPIDLKIYEPMIREKLSNINNLKKIILNNGNHERNSDHMRQDFDETLAIVKALEEIKRFTHSDMEVVHPNFIMNKYGDVIKADYYLDQVNGYNIVYTHKTDTKGSTPAIKLNNWCNSMGGTLPRIDEIDSAHYHKFESVVMDDRLITITGSGCGQTSFEHNLGLTSKPLFVIKTHREDGSIELKTIGKEFLRQYKTKNPEVNEMGFENFMLHCVSEDVLPFTDQKINTDPIYQRRLLLDGKPI